MRRTDSEREARAQEGHPLQMHGSVIHQRSSPDSCTEKGPAGTGFAVRKLWENRFEKRESNRPVTRTERHSLG
jgi:hypothetical protein